MGGMWIDGVWIQQPPVVYFIRANTLRRFKVGWTTNFLARVSDIQICCPAEIVRMGEIFCTSREQAQQVEKIAHSFLEPYHCRGEWFWLTKESKRIVRYFTKYGIDGIQELQRDLQAA